MIMKIKKVKVNMPARPASLAVRPAGLAGRQKDSGMKKDLIGYPDYPASEDIYNKFQEERDINPEDISQTKETNYRSRNKSIADPSEDLSGNDLDVPGAELDDNQESIGSEDEENNYYSLGGDNHNDLEEDKGD
jgi:hypothetical protein